LLEDDEDGDIGGGDIVVGPNTEVYVSVMKKKEVVAESNGEDIVTRIQYLFNFIMNYRSRYAHQQRNKENKFMLDEHQ
jgi:hypothetical protein